MRARNQTISLIASAVGLLTHSLTTPLAAPTVSAKRFRTRAVRDGDGSITGTATGAMDTVAPKDASIAAESTAQTEEHAITIAGASGAAPDNVVTIGDLEAALDDKNKAALESFETAVTPKEVHNLAMTLRPLEETMRNFLQSMQDKVATAQRNVAPALLRLTLIVMTLLSALIPILSSVMYYQKSTNPCGESPEGQKAPHDQCFRPQAVQDAMCADRSDTNAFNACMRNARAPISLPNVYTPYAQTELVATSYIAALPLTLVLINLVFPDKDDKISGSGFALSGASVVAGIILFIMKMTENAWTLKHYMTETGDESYNLAVTNIVSTLWALLFVPSSVGFLFPMIKEWQKNLPSLEPAPYAH